MTEYTHGDVGDEEVPWLFVGDACGGCCVTIRLDSLRPFSRNDPPFFLLVALLARYPKLSLYDLFLLVVNILTVDRSTILMTGPCVDEREQPKQVKEGCGDGKLLYLSRDHTQATTERSGKFAGLAAESRYVPHAPLRCPVHHRSHDKRCQSMVIQRKRSQTRLDATTVRDQ